MINFKVELSTHSLLVCRLPALVFSSADGGRDGRFADWGRFRLMTEPRSSRYTSAPELVTVYNLITNLPISDSVNTEWEISTMRLRRVPFVPHSDRLSWGGV
ncbi:hypothetical protein BaRGS_00022133 [Batillaria attramentaria]|uniref:Uncharacterized protein n=1 Tax=Batillaria attramentaria TaxID=370345 RepID=A0ABD0KHA2_9CAEN